MHWEKGQGALLYRYVFFLQSLKCIQRLVLLKEIDFVSMITRDILAKDVYVCVYPHTY